MIDKNLLKEFEDFCKLNGVDPVKKANEILRNELNIMKYGTSPIDNLKRENSIQEVNDNEEKKMEVEDTNDIIDITPQLFTETTVPTKHMIMTINKNNLTSSQLLSLPHLLGFRYIHPDTDTDKSKVFCKTFLFLNILSGYPYFFSCFFISFSLESL